MSNQKKETLDARIGEIHHKYVDVFNAATSDEHIDSTIKDIDAELLEVVMTEDHKFGEFVYSPTGPDFESRKRKMSLACAGIAKQLGYIGDGTPETTVTSEELDKQVGLVYNGYAAIFERAVTASELEDAKLNINKALAELLGERTHEHKVLTYKPRGDVIERAKKFAVACNGISKNLGWEKDGSSLLSEPSISHGEDEDATVKLDDQKDNVKKIVSIDGVESYCNVFMVIELGLIKFKDINRLDIGNVIIRMHHSNFDEGYPADIYRKITEIVTTEDTMNITTSQNKDGAWVGDHDENTGVVPVPDKPYDSVVPDISAGGYEYDRADVSYGDNRLSSDDLQTDVSPHNSHPRDSVRQGYDYFNKWVGGSEDKVYINGNVIHGRKVMTVQDDEVTFVNYRDLKCGALITVNRYAESHSVGVVYEKVEKIEISGRIIVIATSPYTGDISAKRVVSKTETQSAKLSEVISLMIDTYTIYLNSLTPMMSSNAVLNTIGGMNNALIRTNKFTKHREAININLTQLDTHLLTSAYVGTCELMVAWLQEEKEKLDECYSSVCVAAVQSNLTNKEFMFNPNNIDRYVFLDDRGDATYETSLCVKDSAPLNETNAEQYESLISGVLLVLEKVVSVEELLTTMELLNTATDIMTGCRLKKSDLRNVSSNDIDFERALIELKEYCTDQLNACSKILAERDKPVVSVYMNGCQVDSESVVMIKRHMTSSPIPYFDYELIPVTSLNVDDIIVSESPLPLNRLSGNSKDIPTLTYSDYRVTVIFVRENVTYISFEDINRP